MHAPPTFVIGRDTRASGPILEDALVEGIVAGGGDVIRAGVVPTPAVAFLTTELGVESGVVISASHNPPEDNGIKFFGFRGFKLSDRLEDEIEAEIAAGRRRGASRPGASSRCRTAARRYLDHVVAAAEARLDGMRVVVDCANGAASAFAPDVLRRLGRRGRSRSTPSRTARTSTSAAARSTPRWSRRRCVAHGADAGVAHDGDADRALFADADGNVIDGDQVLGGVRDLDEGGRRAHRRHWSWRP